MTTTTILWRNRLGRSATALIMGMLFLCAPAMSNGDEPGRRPNVLFISIDDLNDWIGALGGHPQARTPHMDRLAQRGVLFSNAHCQAPLCNPSRTSVMMGLRPSTTGVYGLAPWFRTVEQWKGHVTLPQYFGQQGYKTYSAGKVYHGNYPPRAERAREFDEWGPPGGVGRRPEEKLVQTPFGNHPLVDWGVWPEDGDDTGWQDYKVATWAVNRIKQMAKEEPFFLAVGFFFPHVPCFATQKWFDLYPVETLAMPPVRENERAHLPRFADYLHWRLPEPRLRWLRDAGQWPNLVRSYLASTSFVDSQIGRVLDALDQAGLTENTVVVLWSDHGFHLGEKEITGKNTLWERSTRVPLIFAGPGVMENAVNNQPAELLDIFPTLVELCGLPTRPDLEGHSLVPQLSDPAAERLRPAITTHNRGNHAVRGQRWRYIRYADGSEELYNMEKDPNEWMNLAGDPKFAPVIEEHRRWLPKFDAAPVPGSAHRLLTYDPKTGRIVWEGEAVGPEDPWPHN